MVYDALSDYRIKKYRTVHFVRYYYNEGAFLFHLFIHSKRFFGIFRAKDIILFFSFQYVFSFITQITANREFFTDFVNIK